MAIWSNTALPFECLMDEKRTNIFKLAIEKTVKEGDIVVDLGAGSGILSFLASKQKPKKIHAVEIDQLLANCLKKSVRANKLDHLIEVIEGDIMNANLPQNVDVIIAEIIETGLIDEMQVPIFNMLIDKNIINRNTRTIPSKYTTIIQLVDNDFEFYGYKILVPIHRWPHYDIPKTNWYQKKYYSPLSDNEKIVELDFKKRNHQTVDSVISFKINKAGAANAVRLSGIIDLAPGVKCTSTNALNSDKIIPIENRPVKKEEAYKLRVRYKMGGSLTSFNAAWEN